MTKCPRQIAFRQQLNYLFHVRDDVCWRNNQDLEKHYNESYEEFINKWCPTLKVYDDKEIINDPMEKE